MTDADIATMVQRRAAGLIKDPAGLATFKEANAKLAPPAKGQPRVVFLGDSITAGWARRPFFAENGYVGRGIGGQTSPQMLLRFRQDVLALKPAVVLILAGTNDVAENTGPITDEEIIDNLTSMVEIAHLHKINVVIGSVPPTTKWPWLNDPVSPAPRIKALNAKIKAWTVAQGVTYADFWSVLSMPDGTTNPALSGDSVHPNDAGYQVMEPIAKAAVAKALKAKG